MSIFASRDARRLTRDPFPWLQIGKPDLDFYRDVKPGYDPAGYAAITHRWAPRPEFTPITAHPHNVILDIAREGWDAGDPFGSAMAWLFATLQHWQEWQDARIGTVPVEYGFRNAGHSDSYDPETGEDSEYWDIRDALNRYYAQQMPTRPAAALVEGQDMIVHAAAVFDRIINQARLNGKDY